jgi:hypothetical protein
MMISHKQAREIATQLGYDVTNKPMKFYQKLDLTIFGTAERYLLIGNVSMSFMETTEQPLTVQFILRGVGVGNLVAGNQQYWNTVGLRAETLGGQSPILFCAFDEVSGDVSVAQFQGWAMRLS